MGDMIFGIVGVLIGIACFLSGLFTGFYVDDREEKNAARYKKIQQPELTEEEQAEKKKLKEIEQGWQEMMSTSMDIVTGTDPSMFE